MIGRTLLFLALIPGLAAGPVAALAGCSRAGVSAKTGKIGPELLALHDAYREARRSGVDFQPNNPLIRVVDDRVLIDATAAGDPRALEADLAALGMRHAAAFGRIVSGELPIAAIPTLATLETLAFARAATPTRSPVPREMPSRP